MALGPGLTTVRQGQLEIVPQSHTCITCVVGIVDGNKAVRLPARGTFPLPFPCGRCDMKDVKDVVQTSIIRASQVTKDVRFKAS